MVTRLAAGQHGRCTNYTKQLRNGYETVASGARRTDGSDAGVLLAIRWVGCRGLVGYPTGRMWAIRIGCRA
eukprot:480254-Prorocentrum_minimum.AAC.6